MGENGSADDPADDGSRTFGNLFLLAAFLILVGCGVWMAFALDDARRAQDCIAQGRRNCAPIDVPVRGG